MTLMFLSNQAHLSCSIFAQSDGYIPRSAADLAIFNVLLLRSPAPVDGYLHRLSAAGTDHGRVILEGGHHREQKGAASLRPLFACS